MNSYTSLWTKILWFVFTLSFAAVYHFYDASWALILAIAGGYQLYKFDMLEVAAIAVRRVATEYENDYPEIEEAETELVEELTMESERTILTSHLFSKRMEETE